MLAGARSPRAMLLFRSLPRRAGSAQTVRLTGANSIPAKASTVSDSRLSSPIFSLATLVGCQKTIGGVLSKILWQSITSSVSEVRAPTRVALRSSQRSGRLNGASEFTSTSQVTFAFSHLFHGLDTWLRYACLEIQ